MSVYQKTYALTGAQFGGVPCGNRTALSFKMETTAGGVVKDSNATAALAAADVVNLGLLPAGCNLLGAMAIVSAAFTATSTATIGFAYVDGVDSADVPQDADYFFAALGYNAAGRTLATNTAVAPVTLPKDAYLTLTNNTAAQATAGRIDIVVDCVLRGAV